MTRFCNILMLLGVLLVLPAIAQVSPEETQAFDLATKASQDELWTRAEQEWKDFTIKYPSSSRLAEAVLFQARALVELGNYPGAIQLLQENLAQAGDYTAEYLFLIGFA